MYIHNIKESVDGPHRQGGWVFAVQKVGPVVVVIIGAGDNLLGAS
jgi:hypothetical protein